MSATPSVKNNIPIYVINLEKDRHKKEHMQEMADKNNLQINFIEAIYGKDLSQVEVDDVSNHEKSLEVIGRKLFRGEVGVALSQMSIYRKMIENNIEVALIFEDDVIIDNSIHEALSCVNTLPDDWELLLLGYHRNFISNTFHRISFKGKTKISKHYKAVRFTDKMDGAFGYLINLNGAKKLLKVLETGIFMPVDNYTGVERYINLYGILPRCIHVDISLESNINVERKAYKNPNKLLNKNSNFKSKLKNKFDKLGLLKYIQKVNGLRIKLLIEAKHLPKQFKNPKKYIKG